MSKHKTHGAKTFDAGSDFALPASAVDPALVRTMRKNAFDAAIERNNPKEAFDHTARTLVRSATAGTETAIAAALTLFWGYAAMQSPSLKGQGLCGVLCLIGTAAMCHSAVAFFREAREGYREVKTLYRRPVSPRRDARRSLRPGR
ncbi:MAG: hypothetical protein PHE27_07080 [Alphaproteobacteria bacterium]|nr:hypothetical protein [Alphaproteobacteria bacterium]